MGKNAAAEANRELALREQTAQLEKAMKSGKGGIVVLDEKISEMGAHKAKEFAYIAPTGFVHIWKRDVMGIWKRQE